MPFIQMPYPDALDAVRASAIVKRIENQLASADNDQLIRQEISAFLTKYEHHQPNNDLQSLRDQTSLIPLCRLCSSLDFFISDFSLKALTALRKPLPLPRLSDQRECRSDIDGSIASLSLSETEKGRLQRAVFRSELYRALFHMSKAGHRRRPLFSATEQARLFLPRFAPWEIEELACIYQYLAGTLGDVFDKLEDDFVEDVMAEAAVEPCPMTLKHTRSTASDDSFSPHTQMPSYSQSSPDHSQDKSYAGMEMLDFLALNFFEKYEKRLYHEHYITNLISRGLPFLKLYLRLDAQRRKDLTFGTNSRSDAASFPELLMERPYQLQDNDQRAPGGDQFHGDSLCACNYGWVWANRDEGRMDKYGLPCNFDLRIRGYVFWDKDRLQISGILDRPRAIEKSESDFPSEYRDRREMPSAEERLGGIRVKVEVLRRLSLGEDWDAEDEHDSSGDALD